VRKADEIATPTSCLNKAADDEPIFVLRAHDPIAGPTVRAWIALAEKHGLHKDKIIEAHNIADDMEDWHIENVPPL